MKEKQWVQHISGQGEKWLVSNEDRPSWMKDGCKPNDSEWLVCDRKYGAASHLLPKSEYRLCEPPQRLEDATEECTVETDSDGCQSVIHEGKARFVTAWYGKGYALRKVLRDLPEGRTDRYAFIVEKKVMR